jgi:glycosyltransferase involved in cell wall biosynthesis
MAAIIEKSKSAARPVASRSILMAGTDLDGQGGIRAAIRGLVDVGLFRQFNVTYVITHRYGSLWGKMTSAIGGWLRVAYYLWKLDAPLVHVQASCRASFWRKSVVCCMARIARRPYIVHVHSGEFVDFYRRECGPAGRYIIRRVFANAQLVIALSEEWRERLLEICPTANTDVLSNSVALPDAAPTLAGNPGAPILLYLGFIKHAKGTDDLVRAFARIAGRFPTLQLLCGGTGSLSEMRELATQLGVQDRVHFPGWIGPEQKREAMARAAMFILPSYAEGMPMSLLEAMAWGLPTIATPVGGICQLVTHEKNGLLVPPGDIDALAAAITRLMTEPGLCQKLAAAARRTVETGYTREAALARLSQIYRRCGVESRS